MAIDATGNNAALSAATAQGTNNPKKCTWKR
jgi:hypothetical protein